MLSLKKAKGPGRWARLLACVASGVLGLAASTAMASTSGVVISQIYGGNGNTYASDYVELFNAGAAPVSITGWSVQYSSAAGTGLFSANGVTALTGSLQPGQYHLVKLATTTGSALPTADSVGTTNMSGTAGKVILANVGTGLACNGSSTPCNATQLAQIVDLVGYGSTANFFEGAGPAPAPSSTTALFRALGGCTDTNQNGSDFSVGAPAPRNSTAALEPCGGPPPVGQIVPVCPATVSVAQGAAINTALTASDTDSIVNGATITSTAVNGISLSSFVSSPSIGANATVNLSLASTTAAGTYPVAVNFTNGDGQNASCNISVAVTNPGAYTPVYDIQGTGATAALLGVRTTRGIVTKVTNNGYFLQDEIGDGNPLTSDGIYVFTSTAPTVTAGQQVQITGTVTEFDVSGTTSNPTAEANPLTEFTSITSTIILGTGTITPIAITLPLANAADFERYEGMLVTIAGPLTASQNYFQGRYGQVTMSAGGRLVKPTNVHRPGTAQALAAADLNARNSFLLDDGSSQQNPNPTPYIGGDNTLRAGDTLSSLTGVVDYGLATSSASGITLYRVQPTVTPSFTRANARTAAPAAVGGNVKVASFNVLNFFTTFTDGTTATGGTGQGCSLGSAVSAANCRGADSLTEFTRQRTKIVEAMAAINADVFGLMEIQNNANTAAQNLVDALNAKVGANTYAVVPLPPTTGTDAIRVAMIYKPGTLTAVGSSMSDASAVHNRPPFAATFRAANNEKFSVVVNHFKSKGSCPTDGSSNEDQGDGQGCWNTLRTQQAQALLTFIGSVQTAAGDSDVVVIGDLNAYGREDPVDALTAAGLVDQLSRFDAAAYSYVFDGEAGYLDHGLVTASLSTQVASALHWHVNADEPSIIDYNAEFKQPACASCGPDYYSATPYRSSDHDPVVIGLSLKAAQTITFASPADRAVDSGSFVLSATSTSGLTVVFSDGSPSVCTVTPQGTVTLVGVGLCSISANQAGDASYAAATTVIRSFNVNAATPIPQTINFTALADRALGSGSFTVAATASSGLAVSFSSLTPATCSVNGSTVALLALGTCTVAADQPGNGAYAPAPQEARSFAITATNPGGGNADIPTLPEWGAMLLGLTLLSAGMRRQAARRGRG